LLRDLHLASLSLYEELSKELKDGFDFWQQGLLMLYTTEGGRLECSEMVEQAEKMGVRARLLNTGEIRELDANIRTHAPGGAYYPQDSHIDPARFVVNLAKHVQGNDDTIQVATDVLDFEAVNGKIETVRTSKGDFSADQIVLTAGAWSPTLIRNLKLKLPIQPAKGYSITLNHTQDIPQIPLILEEAKVAVTPLGDRLRFAGTLELAGLDLSFNMRRVHAVLKAVPRYLDTEPVNLEQAEIWAGLRPCTPDGLPIIGRCPSINNLIVATGHAMIGISLAPITGKLIAELVNEEQPSIDLEALRVERFN
nr:FAD-dependent oxidoreductase [candidate division KSB1 bacterium]NIR70842.1 FAD-dependent oxidoreductase [candidate division KSB1 bacterium]NIS24628.1 FAD-dependent oxidoreductase [candidate division KSB1 bacterium]NIT71530.1 FAD-dependent oxidoreductase [candidate division KSB1 bacterium]NIU25228.1 FAD-dependent oxidoreductase [candidate division KSB1 bacterium]